MKIAALKAQADLEAERMRQRIAEKQKERIAAAGQDQPKEHHVSAITSANGKGDGGDSEQFPAVKDERDRPHWGPQPQIPIAFAQEVEATGKVTAGGMQ